ncbi:hypothetical protein A3863_04820 [Priestia endophytica]|uniref:hypothetical protein n=1 Tax=Priestia endophytica TaxID=135735 RepID=UPI000DCA8392|nr:hypothetical protein [Priestia endophytica]RAS91804.1 hypothetical protein A3863_04820 [Priestia endophytica]
MNREKRDFFNSEKPTFETKNIKSETEGSIIEKREHEFEQRDNGPVGYRPKYQLRRMKWTFHAYDDDPFPSIPHGHSLDGNVAYKLEVYDGDIYSDGVVHCRLRKSDYERLWNDEKFKELVEKAKKYHADKELGQQLQAVGCDDFLIVEFETEVEIEVD